MDPFEKTFREVSGHPHAAMGRGIPRKIAGMHADGLTELHIEWHGRGLIMASWWDVGAGSGTRRFDPAGTIDHRSEALRVMVNILVNNRESTCRRRPTRFARGDGRDQTNFGVFDKVCSLLGKIDKHPCSGAHIRCADESDGDGRRRNPGDGLVVGATCDKGREKDASKYHFIHI